MSLSHSLAALSLAAITASPLAAQAADSARLHDLRAVLGADTPDRGSVDLRLPVSASDIDRIYPDDPPLLAGEVPYLVDAEVCLRLVRAAIEADPAAEAEDVRSLPGRVLVVGNGAAHAAADRVVRALTAATAPRVAIEVVRIPRGDLERAPEAVLDASEAAALLEGHTAAPRATATAAFGRSEFIGRTTWTAHLRDFDVEVAQGAIAADPTVTRFPTGETLGLRIDPSAGGDLVVRVWGRACAPRSPLRTIELPGFGGSALQLAEIDTSIFLASGIVPSGGALCVDAGDGDVLVVRARDGGEGDGAATLRLGALATEGMFLAPIQLSTIVPSRGLDPAEERLFPTGSRRWSGGGLGARGVLDALLRRPDLAGAAVFVGTLAVGPWGPAVRDAVQAEAAALEAGVGTYAFEFASGAVPSADVAALTSDPARLAAFADGAPGRMAGAALHGDTLMLLAGTERAYLQDHDVQVAAGAVVADPIVEQTFDGARVWCAPLGLVDGEVRALLDVRAQEGRLDPGVREVRGYVPREVDGDEGEALMTGGFRATLPIEVGTTRAQGTRTLASLAPGEWETVTAQPIAGTDTTFVLAVRCRVKGL